MAGKELVREVTYENRRLASLRCYDDATGSTIVEAVVFPAAGGDGQSKPYRFANAHEAFRFVQEAMLTLQYLGCSVA